MSYYTILDGEEHKLYNDEQFNAFLVSLKNENNKLYKNAKNQAWEDFQSLVRDKGYYVYNFDCNSSQARLMSECGFKTHSKLVEYYNYTYTQSSGSEEEYYHSGYSGTIDSNGSVDLKKDYNSYKVRYTKVKCKLYKCSKTFTTIYAFCEQKNQEECVKKMDFLLQNFDSYQLNNIGRVIEDKRYVRRIPYYIFFSGVLMLALGIFINICLNPALINLSLIVSIFLSIFLLLFSILQFVAAKKHYKCNKNSEVEPSFSLFVVIPNLIFSLMVVICAALKPNTFFGDYNNYLTTVIWISSVINYCYFIYYMSDLHSTVKSINDSDEKDKKMRLFDAIGGMKKYKQTMEDIRDLIIVD